MRNIPTPHISAKAGDFADTVLMPGDPKRAEFVAETMLQDAVIVSDVRGIRGYTGTYVGKRVSVMASGMGMASIGIYAHELYNYYDVKSIIRVGTAGAIAPSVGMRDVVAGMSCCTESTFGFQFGFSGSIAPTASFPLLVHAARTAERLGIRLHVGPLYCSEFGCVLPRAQPERGGALKTRRDRGGDGVGGAVSVRDAGFEAGPVPVHRRGQPAYRRARVGGGSGEVAFGYAQAGA